MTINTHVLHAFLIFLAVMLVGALAVVGSVNAYHARHQAEHRDRLQRLLISHPTEPQLHQILGGPWRACSTAEAVTLAQQSWGAPPFFISTDLARRAPRTLIYLVDDMVYLLFIDSKGAMVDFVLLRN